MGNIHFARIRSEAPWLAHVPDVGARFEQCEAAFCTHDVGCDREQRARYVFSVDHERFCRCRVGAPTCVLRSALEPRQVSQREPAHPPAELFSLFRDAEHWARLCDYWTVAERLRQCSNVIGAIGVLGNQRLYDAHLTDLRAPWKPFEAPRLTSERADTYAWGNTGIQRCGRCHERVNDVDVHLGRCPHSDCRVLLR